VKLQREEEDALHLSTWLVELGASAALLALSAATLRAAPKD